MRKLPVVVVLPLVVLAGRPARATKLVPMSVPLLTRQARWVILGRIATVQSFWVGGKVLTRNVVAVSEAWKGPRVARLEFYTLGGRVGRYSMRVIGAPRFARGQEVILFLAQRRSRLFVAGMVQGAFQVIREPGRAFALRSWGGATWTGRPPRRRWRLDHLRAQVLAAVGRRPR